MEFFPSPLVPEVARVRVPVAGYRMVKVEPERAAVSREQSAALAQFEASARARRQRGELPPWWAPATKRPAQAPPPWADLRLEPVIREWPQPVYTTFPLRDQPTLYRSFAALADAEPEQFLKFANEHGQLGLGSFMLREPIEVWIEAVHAVADALALVDATRTRGAAARLAAWITWRGDVATLAMQSGTRTLAATSDRTRQLQAGYHLSRGDSPRASQLFVQQLVNTGLEGHAVARVLWNPGRKALELRVQPGSLLGILWLQVAMLATGQVADRACAAPGCSAWFPVARGHGFRADKTTCSELCRKRLERSRAAKVAPARRASSGKRPPKRTPRKP